MTVPLTVLVPTYARTEMLGELLWCLAHQSVEPFQVLVFNDCPWQELHGYAPGVHYINHVSYPTMGEKRQALMLMSRTERVAWVDDDDLVAHDFVQRYNEAFNHPSMPEVVYHEQTAYLHGRDGDHWGLGENAYMNMANLRASGIKCPFQKCNYGEDWHFRATFAREEHHTRTLTIPHTTYVYRKGYGGRTLSDARHEGTLGMYREDAARRRDQGREPLHKVEIVPRLRRDYFATAPEGVARYPKEAL